ncbi:MAG: molybdopterin-dependent oxidoreductase [Proteobacteria bacterium]|jgi:4-hydroxybenzoyl-CoA reductase subunit alpha|nr:molybdopterin-dependent oxidoreductase [Pseudomonadota bacterium]
MSDHRVLNTRAVRVDAFDKATGRAVYVDDITRPDMLHAALLQSPVAHGRIKRLDTSRAAALPGVVAIVTAAEAGDAKFGVSPARYDETVFAIDKVRYLGEEIAAVAADDPVTALRAVSMIDLEIEELPAVLDMEAALADGTTEIFTGYDGNITAEVLQEFGGVDAARPQADKIYKDHLLNKMQDGAFMEPQGCIAEIDGRGVLTLTSSTQTPHYVQRTIAMMLRMPLEMVRVVKPYVGGGFGPKASASNLELACCLLAVKTGRPVKCTLSREQVFLRSRARHQFLHEMEVGLKNDGSLVFLDHRCVLDGGAYSSFGIATIYYAGSLLGGPYRLPNMRYHGVRVCTNKPAKGAQRGHGGVIARALFESILDRAAEELGMDPVELRIKNMMSAGETTCNDLNMSSLGMKECIEKVRDLSGWKKKKGALGGGKGIGVACGFFVSGAGYPIYRSGTWHCTATVQLAETGGVAIVRSASAEIGQGSDTMLAMITAEELGIPLESVRVMSGDTDFGVDLGAYSSRQTLMTGHAIRSAAIDARRQVAACLAEAFGVPAEKLVFRDGFVALAEGELDIAKVREQFVKEHRGFVDHPTGARLTFREASRLAFVMKGTIIGRGEYKPPALGGQFKGAAVGTSPAYGCSAQIMEVEVDAGTGQLSLEHVTAAHDCGFAINRTQVEGQMQGNFLMGLGEACFEEVKFDDLGRTVNPNLAEYKIPTMMDVPNMDPVVVESGEPNGPYGAKEVGEGGIMPTIPAIMNAVYDATGIRFRELPLTPERVLMALKQKREGQPVTFAADAKCEAVMELVRRHKAKRG